MINRYDKFTTYITNINRYIQKIKNIEMEELGLKGKQVQCLFHLCCEKDGLSSKELCNRCGEDKASISRTIKELENCGYVYVNEEGEKKYRNPIKLTDKGNEIGKLVIKKINDCFSLGCDGIKDDERAILYYCLELISNNLKNICEDLGDKNYD